MITINIEILLHYIVAVNKLYRRCYSVKVTLVIRSFIIMERNSRSYTIIMMTSVTATARATGMMDGGLGNAKPATSMVFTY